MAKIRSPPLRNSQRKRGVSEVPKVVPRRTPRTRFAATLLAKPHHGKRIQSTSHKGESCTGRIQRESGTHFQERPPGVGGHGRH